MSCPYAHNAFCRSLSPKTRAQLCACCSIRKYAQGQHLDEDYFAHLTMLTLDGMIAKMELDPITQKPVTTGIGTCGTLFSIGDLVSVPEIFSDKPRDTLCVTEVTAAIFDMDVVRHLYQTNIEFVHKVFDNVFIYCLLEKTVMMRDIGRGDVYSAVRYMVKFCRDRKLPQLTHEQIALLCSRSRPTVTSTLHQLLKNEPELFQPLEECE